MNTTNTINVVLGMMQKIATRAIYQTDSGWRLMVRGHNLPETLQVDFANTTTGDNALTFTFNTAEGVDVPTSLIRQGRDIHCYIVLTSMDYSITKYDITLPVAPRARTADDPTPEQRSYIDEAVKTCTDAAARSLDFKYDCEECLQKAGREAETATDAASRAEDAASRAEEAASGIVPTSPYELLTTPYIDYIDPNTGIRTIISIIDAVNIVADAANIDIHFTFDS